MPERPADATLSGGTQPSPFRCLEAADRYIEEEPSPVVLTSLLPTAPAVRPSNIHETIDIALATRAAPGAATDTNFANAESGDTVSIDVKVVQIASGTTSTSS
jgi:hypothetical protein